MGLVIEERSSCFSKKKELNFTGSRNYGMDQSLRISTPVYSRQHPSSLASRAISAGHFHSTTQYTTRSLSSCLSLSRFARSNFSFHPCSKSQILTLPPINDLEVRFSSCFSCGYLHRRRGQNSNTLDAKCSSTKPSVELRCKATNAQFESSCLLVFGNVGSDRSVQVILKVVRGEMKLSPSTGVRLLRPGRRPPHDR